jgi:hypothetical protein
MDVEKFKDSKTIAVHNLCQYRLSVSTLQVICMWVTKCLKLHKIAGVLAPALCLHELICRRKRLQMQIFLLILNVKFIRYTNLDAQDAHFNNSSLLSDVQANKFGNLFFSDCRS